MHCAYGMWSCSCIQSISSCSQGYNIAYAGCKHMHPSVLGMFACGRWMAWYLMPHMLVSYPSTPRGCALYLRHMWMLLYVQSASSWWQGYNINNAGEGTRKQPSMHKVFVSPCAEPLRQAYALSYSLTPGGCALYLKHVPKFWYPQLMPSWIQDIYHCIYEGTYNDVKANTTPVNVTSYSCHLQRKRVPRRSDPSPLLCACHTYVGDGSILLVSQGEMGDICVARPDHWWAIKDSKKVHFRGVSTSKRQ